MKYFTAAVAVFSLTSGCAHEVGLPDYYPAETEARFGDSVRQNIAAQTVNPDAPGEEALTASGARTAIAQKRYEENNVKKPVAASTLRATRQSGSGGSE